MNHIGVINSDDSHKIKNKSSTFFKDYYKQATTSGSHNSSPHPPARMTHRAHRDKMCETPRARDGHWGSTSLLTHDLPDHRTHREASQRSKSRGIASAGRVLGSNTGTSRLAGPLYTGRRASLPRPRKLTAASLACARFSCPGCAAPWPWQFPSAGFYIKLDEATTRDFHEFRVLALRSGCVGVFVCRGWAGCFDSFTICLCGFWWLTALEEVVKIIDPWKPEISK